MHLQSCHIRQHPGWDLHRLAMKSMVNPGVVDLRLQGTATDDALMRGLLERKFAQRGLDARPELIEWLVARIERSHVAVMRTVDALDQEVLERRKRLSIPLARTTLAAAALIPKSPEP